MGLLSKYTGVQHKVLRTVYDGLNKGTNLKLTLKKQKSKNDLHPVWWLQPIYNPSTQEAEAGELF